MKKHRVLKRVLISLLSIILVIGIAFSIYVSIYYHAEPFDESNYTVTVKETSHYITYGSESSTTGFIFYPGAKVEEQAYEPILISLAEEGIFVITVKMPFHFAFFGVDKATDVIKEYEEVQDWYIGGHSLGGAMAASWVHKHPEKVQGLILLASFSSDTISEEVKTLLLYGSNDGVLNLKKYKDYLSHVPNYEEYVIEGGNHAQFGNYGKQKKDKDATISKEEQWQQTKDKILEFIKS